MSTADKANRGRDKDRTSNDNRRMGLAGQGCRADHPGQRGYAMAALLVGLSVMSVMMAAALPVWSHATRREREEELVWRGEQYKRAIMLFQRKFANTFPPNIDILVEQKFLRKKYKDPITGEDFQIIPVGGNLAGPGGPGAPGAGAGGFGNNPARAGLAARSRNRVAAGSSRAGSASSKAVSAAAGRVWTAAKRVWTAAKRFRSAAKRLWAAAERFGRPAAGGVGQQPGGFGQQPGAGGRVGGGTPGTAAGDGHSGRDVEEQGDVHPAIQRDGQVQPVGLRLPRRVGTSRVWWPAVRQARPGRIQSAGCRWLWWGGRRGTTWERIRPAGLGVWTARRRLRPEAGYHAAVWRIRTARQRVRPAQSCRRAAQVSAGTRGRFRNAGCFGGAAVQASRPRPVRSISSSAVSGHITLLLQ